MSYLSELSSEPIESIYANLFEIILENSKGETIDDVQYHFFAYEKIVYGKDPFLKLHFNLVEGKNVYNLATDIKKITVNAHKANGHCYLTQIFLVEYLNYGLCQNIGDATPLNISFQYKVLDQDVQWHD